MNEDLIYNLRKKALNSSITNKHASALIHNKNRYPLAIGFNQYIKTLYIKKKESNEMQIYYKTIHAEIDVFNNYHKNIKGLDLIVIRIGNTNKLKNSRPCNDCIDKLKKIGIRKVYYSNENGKIVSEYVDEMKYIHISSGNRIKSKLNFD